tara:strand:+ start:175 stop:534 length:360 start_codon:yes stop_codon:yes gene_type:complete
MLRVLSAFVILFIPIISIADDVVAGKMLYDVNCASCHGDTGKGDGPVGSVITPRARNLVVGDFKFDTDNDGVVGSDNDLSVLIKQGAGAFGGSPLMPPWPFLSDTDIASLLVYIRSLKQ